MDVPGPPHESLEKQADSDVNMDVPGPSHESFLDSLPPWVSTNLRSPNSWKLLARCWLSSWAAFLLLIPQPSLNILGNTYVASFIFAITSVWPDINRAGRSSLFCLACSCHQICQSKCSYLWAHIPGRSWCSALILFFIRPTKIISTLVVGVLLGWGIGAAAMRGALAARNQVVLQSTLQKVQSRYVYLHSSRSQISV